DLKHIVKILEWTGLAGDRRCGKPEPNGLALARLYDYLIVGRGLGAFLLGVNRIVLAVHYEVIDAVLHIGAAIGHAEYALGVGLVFREQKWYVAFAMQVVFA